jgi:hypothetical protein
MRPGSEHRTTCGNGDHHPAPAGVSVPDHVGDGLGDDPERRHLGSRRERWKQRDRHVHPQPSPSSEPVHRLLDRTGQAQFIELRRAKTLDHPA